MGWDNRPSTRRETLPPDWEKRRKAQLKRDGKRCQWGSLEEDRAVYGMCDRLAREVDHCGDSQDHDNLRSLCTPHHAKRSARQGAAKSAEVRKARVAARKTSSDRHPGLLAPDELPGWITPGQPEQAPGDPEAYPETPWS